MKILITFRRRAATTSLNRWISLQSYHHSVDSRNHTCPNNQPTWRPTPWGWRPDPQLHLKFTGRETKTITTLLGRYKTDRRNWFSLPMSKGTFSVGFSKNSLLSCCCKSRNNWCGVGPDGTAGNGVSAVGGKAAGMESPFTPCRSLEMIGMFSRLATSPRGRRVLTMLVLRRASNLGAMVKQDKGKRVGK